MITLFTVSVKTQITSDLHARLTKKKCNLNEVQIHKTQDNKIKVNSVVPCTK